MFAVYAGASLLNDPRAYLGTDTGGKVATLEVMAERNRLDPDIGYWAERWDPDGRVHPLYYTTRYGDRWINATTLPMLYAAYPLYELGGYRLILVLPMLGSVLSALAARALARRLVRPARRDGDRGGDAEGAAARDGRASPAVGTAAAAAAGEVDGWAAFWVVGLASPLLIYALDFWEHSIGVAAMAWAVVVLLDAVEDRRRWPAFLAAGALFGGAATLRTEALVYAFVAVGAACLALLVWRRRPVAAVAGGAAAVAGMVVPLALNYALEVATVGRAVRFGRAAGTASAAVTDGGTGASSRVEEAMLNAAALTPRLEPLSYLIGLALLALLAFATLRAARARAAAVAGDAADAGPAVMAAAGVLVLYLLRFAAGPGFVPGLVAATPLAVVGAVLGWRTAAGRYVLGVGLVALPLVWATQFSGGASPQWAGRYLLTSGLLLGVAGVVALPALPPWARTGVVGLAVAVSVFGVVWTSVRTHDFGRSGAALNRRPEPVLVSRLGHLVREGGVFYGERRWLTAPTDDDQRFAVDVLEQAGVTRFAVVRAATGSASAPTPAADDIAGWRHVGTDRLELVDEIQLTITTYEAA